MGATVFRGAAAWVRSAGARVVVSPGDRGHVFVGWRSSSRVALGFDATASTGTIGSAPHQIPKRSEEHTSELQSHLNLVCRLLLEKKKCRRLCTRMMGMSTPVRLIQESPGRAWFRPRKYCRQDPRQYRSRFVALQFRRHHLTTKTT